MCLLLVDVDGCWGGGVLTGLPTHKTRSDGGNDGYLAFIDASLAALVAPVLCCLYALERNLYLYHLLRCGWRQVGRGCLGSSSNGGKREREEAGSASL